MPRGVLKKSEYDLCIMAYAKQIEEKIKKLLGYGCVDGDEATLVVLGELFLEYYECGCGVSVMRELFVRYSMYDEGKMMECEGIIGELCDVDVEDGIVSVKKRGGNYHSELLRLVSGVYGGDEVSKNYVVEVVGEVSYVSEVSRELYESSGLEEYEGEMKLGDLVSKINVEGENGKNPGIYVAGVIGGMLSERSKKGLKSVVKCGRKGPRKGVSGNGYSNFVREVSLARLHKSERRVELLKSAKYKSGSKSKVTYEEFRSKLDVYLGKIVKLEELTSAIEFEDERAKRYTVYVSGVLWGLLSESSKSEFGV